MHAFSKTEIERLLERLSDELARASTRADINLVGGAVMCMVFDSRESTRDVDATFRPSNEVRDAALRVAEREGIPDSWLNDAVKAYLSDTGEYDLFLELSHLRVYVAKPEYMLAMKCLAMRIGEGMQDENDIRYLLRHLDVERHEDAISIIAKYYREETIPPTAKAALREILGGD